MLKGLNAPGDRTLGPLKRLAAFLQHELPAESVSSVDHAVSILQGVTHVRNGGQHAGAADVAAMALPSLGLTFPIVDHGAAWRTVQARVVEALDTLRDEIGATA
jgi:hypothetical protein